VFDVHSVPNYSIERRVRALAMTVALFALAWSGRFVSPVRASQPSAHPGRLGPMVQPANVAGATAADVKGAIEASLINGLDTEFVALPPVALRELAGLYQRRAHLPLWIDATGRPGLDASDALTMLRAAADDGLEPADYAVGQLDRLTSKLRTAPPSIADLASFDVALSASMLRYLHHLHAGRIDPRTIGLRLTAPADQHDFAALVQSAVAEHRVAEAVADLMPPLAQYRALRTTLTKYRSIAREVDSAAMALPAFARVVRPGEAYPGIDALLRRLMALGDLPAGTEPSTATVYRGALVDGVKRFQRRHGLAPDGIIGRSTHAALRIPIASRVRQIELALERLRWLPHLGEQRLLAIDIPMFRLWVWDTIPHDGEPLFGMDVIVGRALRTQTPVFVEELQELIFRPYWNVPSSIVRYEILPRLDRDPEYLRREQMEIVLGPGDDARVVAATPENLVRLRQGTLRLRQRPGPHNALGLVKFVFPNPENVYVHGTPAQSLFSRSRRDFSHGCVRAENPIALAEWALKDQPDWSRDRIVSAMNGTQSIHVRLPRPIQVVLFYTTAAVMPDDGTIHFAEDIYLQDALLDRAFARRVG
jgi:L,D-transpeptidase YcbB